MSEKFPIVLGGEYISKHGAAKHTSTLIAIREQDGFRVGLLARVGLPPLELWSNGNGWKDVDYIGHPMDRVNAIDEAMADLSRAVASKLKK